MIEAGAADIRAERGVLLAVALGTILAPLNSTMIAVALPQIMDDLGVKVSSAGWLVTSYLLGLALLQPITGRLGDRFGRRRLVLGGLVAFGLASVGAALAPSLATLIAFRVLQAVAGAVALPNGIAILRGSVPALKRAHAFGLVGGAAGLAAAVGPVLGGVVIAVADWRAIFYVNLPIVFAALALSVRALPRGRAGGDTEPLLPLVPRLFRLRPFAAANAGIAFGNLAFYTMLIATPILLENGIGWSTAAAGLALTALSAPSIVLAPVGGRLADRFGRRLPAVMGLGIFSAALVPLVFGAGESAVGLLACLAGAGVGFGLATASLQTSAVETAPPEHAGVASGLFSTSRYAGSIAGTIVLGAVLTSTGSDVDGFVPVAVVIVVAAFLSTAASFGLVGRPPHRPSPVVAPVAR